MILSFLVYSKTGDVRMNRKTLPINSYRLKHVEKKDRQLPSTDGPQIHGIERREMHRSAGDGELRVRGANVGVLMRKRRNARVRTRELQGFAT